MTGTAVGGGVGATMVDVVLGGAASAGERVAGRGVRRPPTDVVVLSDVVDGAEATVVEGVR